METHLSLFHNTMFSNLETILIDGEPYFPASRCAKLLGYVNPRKAILDHCKHVVKRDGVSRTTNQHGTSTMQTVTTNFIPEGDLYRLIVRSNLPAAREFDRWLFDDALPSIREHGAYITPGVLDKVLEQPDTFADLMRALEQELRLHKA
ncbi:hypothetical protein LJC07_00575 [Christensenellaceae bacterium OttesenSCG-928-L17]|nr:hypothetical protein [Christensenellaceae bacterium OttesenSCG-928-L17]